eukprot:g16249.t1
MSALDKLVQEQDRGQAVMMPLMKWDDWTPDRLHWTFPAVVHAFPRCLYDVADTVKRKPRRPAARWVDLAPPAVDAGASGAAGAAAVAGGPPAGGAQGSGGTPEVEEDWEMEGVGGDAGGSSGGNKSGSAQGGETPSNSNTAATFDGKDIPFGMTAKERYNSLLCG